MAVYKRVPKAVAESVPAYLSGNDAQVAKTATEAGWGPAEYGGGVSLAQAVPGAPTNSPVGEREPSAPFSRSRLNTSSRTGPVGHVPGGTALPFVQGRPFRGHGPAQGIGNTLLPVPGEIAGSWTDDTALQTNDIHSYDTDTRGWRQLHPNNRIAHWLRFGHANAANRINWQKTSENTGSYPLANAGVDYDTYDTVNVGGYQINDGSRADLWVPGGSNVAYQTPDPPNTTTAGAVTQASADPGMAFA